MATNLTRSTKTHTRSTDIFTVTETTIAGVAMQVRGDAIRYRDLGLIEAEAPTLMWVPDTYGDTPQPGDTLTWNSLGYTVADVYRLAPDGVTISTRLIVQR